LLSVPAKVFCTILLHRLRDSVEATLRDDGDEEAGFRRRQSCVEQIFTLQNITEQCAEFQQPLSINFVDFKKTFDSVHRESLWHIARLYGIPKHYVNIFIMLYLNSRCCVKTDTGFTEMFNIITGVCQGCILSPFLFLLVIDFIMRRAMNGPNHRGNKKY